MVLNWPFFDWPAFSLVFVSLQSDFAISWSCWESLNYMNWMGTYGVAGCTGIVGDIYEISVICWVSQSSHVHLSLSLRTPDSPIYRLVLLVLKWEVA
jgi:hypothetical protein